jgi:lysophospholipase L1-like esterase
MKKVTLLGDSIRLNYENRVIELLGDDYSVFRFDDNCRFAQYTLRALFEYDQFIRGSDVIHWNAGHWDLCDLFGDGPFTPEEQYVATIKRIGGLLLKITPNVIFATTTPVRPENIYNSDKTIRRFNELAVGALSPMGIKINDLYATVSKDIGANICDDLIHLTPAGIELCAAQVADAIKKSVDNPAEKV